MKKVLLLMVAALMISSVAMANHFGVYVDGTGSSCELGAAGFNSTATVCEKFSIGSTGCRFKVTLPPGSNFFSFSTTLVPIGVLTSDLSLGYGQCLNGTIPLGQIVAVLAPGTMTVSAADGFPNIIYTDCSFGEYPGTGGNAYVAGTGPCGEIATEQSTWGSVKALYR
jgi:hypothetical protein